MGSRAVAGCLAFLLFVTLVGAGVLYFLQYQQSIQVEKAHKKAIGLYFQVDRPANTELDPAKQKEALAIWRNEVIPKGGAADFVAEALFYVAQSIEEAEPDAARAYYRRIADQFPASDKANPSTVRLAEFNIRSDPQQAQSLYSKILDATGSSSDPARADAMLGMVKLQDSTSEVVPAPEVRAKYQAIIQQFPDSKAYAEACERLNTINRRLIFEEHAPNEFKKAYFIQKGDLLLKLGNEFLSTVYMLEMINGITANQLQPNQQILVPTWGKIFVVVDKSDYMLRIFRDEDKSFLIEYRVGIGKLEWKTKTGEYVVTNKEFHPPWKGLKYGDPEYPLGERWLGLSPPDNLKVRTGLGIHGTNEPDTIGTSSSAGCIRMTNENVIEAFAMIREKSRVIIQE
jgi:lipoprotein-anchoring transpeptidase ErfK/SrfK